MSNLVDNIIKIYSSPEYLRYKKYHEGNIFAITRTSRQEHMHSAFIAWILDSQASHDLKDFPVRQFLSALIQVKKMEENAKAYLSEETEKLIYDYIVKNGDSIVSSVDVEVPISESGKGKNGQIDILVKIAISGKILPIIIENKIYSGEHDKQTVKYYAWAKSKYTEDKYFEPIFVYLKPSDNKSVPKQPEYIQFSYQDLVDLVIEPSIIVSSNNRTIDYLTMYLQCLSYQTDSEKGDEIMAISKEEQEILEQFYTKNKNLLVAMFDMMLDDDDTDPQAVETAKKLLSGKDYSKYEMDGKIYNKRQLVFAVINKYVEEYHPKTIEDLKAAFPDKKSYYTKIIQGVNEASKGFRHFPETVKTADGSEVWIDNQWGLEKFNKFVSFVSETYGYEITKVS